MSGGGFDLSPTHLPTVFGPLLWHPPTGLWRIAYPSGGQLLGRSAKRVGKCLLEFATAMQGLHERGEAAVGHQELGEGEGAHAGMLRPELVGVAVVRGRARAPRSP